MIAVGIERTAVHHVVTAIVSALRRMSRHKSDIFLRLEVSDRRIKTPRKFSFREKVWMIFGPAERMWVDATEFHWSKAAAAA